MDPINDGAGNTTKGEVFPLIDTINDGKIEAAIEMVMNNPSIVNETDNQLNTPLHYAVAQGYLGLSLIKLLVKKGASVNARNDLGETAEDWFQLFIKTMYHFNSDFSKVMRRAVEVNQAALVSRLLNEGVMSDLRFLQANTLLHWAVDCQQLSVIKVVLERCDHRAVKRLLRCKNSQGMTPLALAQKKKDQLGGETTKGMEITSYLQKKQDAVVAEGGTLLIEPELYTISPGYPCVFQQIDVTLDEINHLENAIINFRQAYNKASRDNINDSLTNQFVLINPLRSTIVKLAYNICSLANHRYRCTDYLNAGFSKCNRKQKGLMRDFFRKLFGKWPDSAQEILSNKLFLSSKYLYEIISSERVDQVIEFSAERTHAGGWTSPGMNKIFLNPVMPYGFMGMLVTLVHEVTHSSNYSYDFFSTIYHKDELGLCIDLKNAYALAVKGTSGQLTGENRNLFEVWQLLKSGNKNPDLFKKDLFHLKTLYSAETQTIATLALAALTNKYAWLDGYPRPALLITNEFIRTTHLATHSESIRSGESFRSDSGVSSLQMDWESSTTSDSASTSLLTQTVAAAAVQMSEQTSASPLVLSPDETQVDKISCCQSILSTFKGFYPPS
jgi:Ankyrin repeat